VFSPPFFPPRYGAKLLQETKLCRLLLHFPPSSSQSPLSDRFRKGNNGSSPLEDDGVTA